MTNCKRVTVRECKYYFSCKVWIFITLLLSSFQNMYTTLQNTEVRCMFRVKSTKLCSQLNCASLSCLFDCNMAVRLPLQKVLRILVGTSCPTTSKTILLWSISQSSSTAYISKSGMIPSLFQVGTSSSVACYSPCNSSTSISEIACGALKWIYLFVAIAMTFKFSAIWFICLKYENSGIWFHYMLDAGFVSLQKYSKIMVICAFWISSSELYTSKYYHWPL